MVTFLSKKIALAGLCLYLAFNSYANTQQIGDRNLPRQEMLSLNIFIEQVLRENPGIQSAEARLSAAKARQKAASKPIYNPEITAEGEKGIDKTYRVGIQQTFDLANKRKKREQIGIEEVKATEAELTVLRQQLIAEVFDALAKYQASQKGVSLAKERTTLLKQFVKLTEDRYANGDIARVEVDLAQLALSEALAQQADAENNLIQDLQTLKATTGLKQETLWPRFSSSLPDPKAEPMDTESLIQQLPAIQVLNHQILSAQAKIQLAKRERIPDPTIGIQGGEEKEINGDANSRLIGVTVSIPLFIRNTYRAEVEAANYDALEAEKKRMDVVRQVRAEIESSASRYQMLYQTVQDWQKTSKKPLSDGVILIERLWQAGELNTTDYLVQLKQRIDSQIAGVELESRAWQAWIAWLKATGQIETLSRRLS